MKHFLLEKGVVICTIFLSIHSSQQLSPKVELIREDRVINKTLSKPIDSLVAKDRQIIEEYNASLSIGGDNLWSIENTPLINVTGTTTKTAIDTVLDYYRFTIDSFDSNGVNITRNSPMLSPVKEQLKI